jgi:ABC-type branched-subunit amino acid transport system substrate-binding protein
MTRLSAAAAILLIVTTSLAAAPKLTEQEARGKQIYLHGEWRGGKPITALMGDEGVEVPATIVPCASCHGTDARGRSEAGVRPSNLRWGVLTRAYEAPGEHSHPPYTRAAVKRAVTMGIDPAGHKLQTAMPRYRMSLTEMDDLIAYLQKLPQDSDPGLTDEAVHIGVVLPEGTHTANARSLVEHYIARLNGAGGIYGRKIELRFAPSPKSLQSFIDAEQPFAIAAASLIGNEDEFESVIDSNQLPSIAAIATREPKGRYSFHLLAGIREQSVALAHYAAQRGAKYAVIVFSDEPPWREIAAEVEGETKLPGCRGAELPSGCKVAGLLSGSPATQTPDAFIVLGPASLQREVLGTSAMSPNPPLVLIPGAIAISVDDLPPALDRRAAIAEPLLPSDASPAGMAELHALGDDSISPAVTGTFISVQLLVEALRHAGRDLGREKLIDTLEGFYDMESGLTPKITFGPNRHTGTNEAHVLVWSTKEKTFVADDGTK